MNLYESAYLTLTTVALLVGQSAYCDNTEPTQSSNTTAIATEQPQLTEDERIRQDIIRRRQFKAELEYARTLLRSAESLTSDFTKQLDAEVQAVKNRPLREKQLQEQTEREQRLTETYVNSLNLSRQTNGIVQITIRDKPATVYRFSISQSSTTGIKTFNVQSSKGIFPLRYSTVLENKILEICPKLYDERIIFTGNLAKQNSSSQNDTDEEYVDPSKKWADAKKKQLKELQDIQLRKRDQILDNNAHNYYWD